MVSHKSFRKQDVEGKPVVYSSGRTAGKVKDLAFNLDGTILLIVEKEGGAENQVPMRMVTGMSDYVVVREETTRPTSPVPPTSISWVQGRRGRNCKFCGRDASPGTTWCPSCGRSLG
ncbi:MAG: PRC-barrel domain-containing protein [Nitrososphaerota archaeon]|nr:PRC-barrel domain-containing protein [Nitrososphaerota archaeon]